MQQVDHVTDGPVPSPNGSPSDGHAENVSGEARLRTILAAIMAFRDGDFSVRLPTDWAGTDGRIAEAFNQAIAHEDRIAREVTRLSVTVGKEGRLKQRMSVPGADRRVGRRRSTP